MKKTKEIKTCSPVWLSSQLSALLWSSVAVHCCHPLHRVVSRPCSALVFHPYLHWDASQLSVVAALVLAVFVFVCLVFCRSSAVCLLYPDVGPSCLLVGLEPEFAIHKFKILNLYWALS